MKEAPPGFEPGMADLQSAVPIPQVQSESKVTPTPDSPLAHSLAHETQIDPDLARLIDAWPTLPTAIRDGILAMVRATGG